MLEDQFNKVVSEQISRSSVMLQNKNGKYNPDSDKLRIFKVTAAMKGETARNALAGMMIKHTASIYDMCASDFDFDMEVWDEKITDHINYLLLLRAVVEEEKPGMDVKEDEDPSIIQFDDRNATLQSAAFSPASKPSQGQYHHFSSGRDGLVQHNFTGFRP